MTAQLDALRDTLAEVDALLTQAEKEKVELFARVTRLEQERAGLVLAVGRLEPRVTISGTTTVIPAGSDHFVRPQSQTGAVGVADAESWADLDRTASVERAMKELARPA